MSDELSHLQGAYDLLFETHQREMTRLHAELAAAEQRAEDKHRAWVAAERALEVARATTQGMMDRIEHVDTVLSPLTEDGETVRAYVMPAGAWHRLLGAARNGSTGTELLAERNALAAELEAARAVMEAGRAGKLVEKSS